MSRYERLERGGQFMRGSPFHVWVMLVFLAGVILTTVAVWEAPDSWTGWAVVGAEWTAVAAYARGMIR